MGGSCSRPATVERATVVAISTVTHYESGEPMEPPGYRLTLQRAGGTRHTVFATDNTKKVGDVVLVYYSPEGDVLQVTDIVNPPPKYEFTVPVDRNGTIRHGVLSCQSDKAARVTVSVSSILLFLGLLPVLVTISDMNVAIGASCGVLMSCVVACLSLGTVEDLFDRFLYHESAVGTRTILVA